METSPRLSIRSFNAMAVVEAVVVGEEEEEGGPTNHGCQGCPPKMAVKTALVRRLRSRKLITAERLAFFRMVLVFHSVVQRMPGYLELLERR